MKPLLIPIIGTLLVISAWAAYEHMLWNECLAAPHSWFYCARVLA